MVRRRPVSGVPEGLRIGHAESADGRSGVTAFLFGRPAPTVVDVRGGAPATYDTASLDLGATFGRRWGLFLSGGSLFGLDAAAGVRRFVLEEGGGHAAFGSRGRRVAPISGAALYDLPREERALPAYGALGYAAAEAARPVRPPTGRVGAGAGATVGKYLGPSGASPGGFGFSSARGTNGIRVAVSVVLNSVGAVRDPATGAWRAGARRKGRIVPPTNLEVRARGGTGAATATNLLVLVTDAPVSRAELGRVLIMAQTGLAQAVVPAHTATDGDVAFASTLAEVNARRPGSARFLSDEVGMLAAQVTVAACLSAVRPVVD